MWKNRIFKTVSLTILVLAMTMMAAAGAQVSLDPSSGEASYCNTTEFDLMVEDVDDLQGGTIYVDCGNGCGEIQGFQANDGAADFQFGPSWSGGKVDFVLSSAQDVSSLNLGTFTVHCNSTAACGVELDLSGSELYSPAGTISEVSLNNSDFSCIAQQQPTPTPTPSEGGEVSFDPSSGEASYCNTTEFDLMVEDVDNLQGGTIYVDCGDGCCDIEDFQANDGAADFQFGPSWSGGKVDFVLSSAQDVSSLNLGTFTVHCNSTAACGVELDLSGSELYSPAGTISGVSWTNGDFACTGQTPTPSEGGEVSFSPSSGEASYCNTAEFDLMVEDVDDLQGGTIYVDCGNGCGEIQGFQANDGAADFQFGPSWSGGKVDFVLSSAQDVSSLNLGTFTVHCNSTAACGVELDLSGSELYSPAGTISGVSWTNGDFACLELVPPQPEITAPSDGETVMNTVEVCAEDQSGEEDIASTMFQYWNDSNCNGMADESGESWMTIGTNNSGDSVCVNWNTNDLANGCYILRTEMTDNDDQTGEDSINVNVSNPAGIKLYRGWNLVPITCSLESKAFDDVMEGIEFDAIGYFDACSDAPCNFVQGFNSFERGRAYAIHVNDSSPATQILDLQCGGISLYPQTIKLCEGKSSIASPKNAETQSAAEIFNIFGMNTYDQIYRYNNQNHMWDMYGYNCSESSLNVCPPGSAPLHVEDMNFPIDPSYGYVINMTENSTYKNIEY